MYCNVRECKSSNIAVLETSGMSHPNLNKINRYAELNNLNPDYIVMRRRICLDCGNRFITFEYYKEEKDNGTS